MPRPSVLKIGTLNFSSAHRNSQKYRDTFIDAFNLKKPIEMAAHRFAMITSLKDEGDGIFITGSLARFNEVDLDLPWFDIEKLTEASDDLIGKISIPNSVRPNYTSIYFAADCQKHKLFFEYRSPTGGISPKEAHKFFVRLFSQSEIVAKYGNYNWSIVSASGNFKSIIKGLKIKTIEFFVQRPNPDDHGDLEKLIEERLRETNSQIYVEKYTAVPGDGIIPNAHMHDLAEVSTTTGETIVRGSDIEGVSIVRSTSDQPKIITHTYPSEHVGERSAFRTAVGVGRSQKAT